MGSKIRWNCGNVDGGVGKGLAESMTLLKARFAHKDSRSISAVERKVLLINA